MEAITEEMKRATRVFRDEFGCSWRRVDELVAQVFRGEVIAGNHIDGKTLCEEAGTER